MDKRSITSTELAAFARQLREQERAPGTIEKYIRDVSAASAWLRGAKALSPCVPSTSWSATRSTPLDPIAPTERGTNFIAGDLYL